MVGSISYNLFSGIVGLLPSDIAVRLLFFRRFGYLPNIKRPRTFNEKIQRRKLYDRSPLLSILADKLESKKYVQSMLGGDVYVPKTLWSGSSVEDLDIGSLPSRFVFKANHASRTNYFFNENDIPTLEKMRDLCASWFKHDQASVLGEWAYSAIEKKVFCEEFMNFDGKVPDDYKFFVYHGKVRFIQLDTGRFTSHKRDMFDRNWNSLGFDYSHPRNNPQPPKPHYLENMISVAEKIASQVDFARVDLYYFRNSVTYGETTIYPGAGFEKFPNYSLDELFGRYWKQEY